MLANLLSAELPGHESTIEFKSDGRCALTIVRGSVVALVEGGLRHEPLGEHTEQTSLASSIERVRVDAHRQNSWMNSRTTAHVIDPACAKAVWARRNLDVEQGPLA